MCVFALKTTCPTTVQVRRINWILSKFIVLWKLLFTHSLFLSKKRSIKYDDLTVFPMKIPLISNTLHMRSSIKGLCRISLCTRKHMLGLHQYLGVLSSVPLFCQGMKMSLFTCKQRINIVLINRVFYAQWRPSSLVVHTKYVTSLKYF